MIVVANSNLHGHFTKTRRAAEEIRPAHFAFQFINRVTVWRLVSKKVATAVLLAGMCSAQPGMR
jgi:hypothetical protein